MFHKLYSRHVDPSGYTCKEKCSACCYYPVSITESEADLLVMRVREGSYNPDGVGCMFLKDDSCLVYSERPLNCRACNSDRDYKECTPDRKFESKNSAMSSVVHSAALTIEPQYMMAEIIPAKLEGTWKKNSE